MRTARFMILRDAREVALEEITQALTEELGERPLLSQRAENLIAIATHYEVRIEDLKIWIRQRSPGKQWTAAEFRRLCEMFATERLAVRQAFEGANHFPSERICPSCTSAYAVPLANGWWCKTCGVVGAA